MRVTPPRTVIRLPLAILILAAMVPGRAAEGPDPEEQFLGLRNGSLIESIAFHYAWLKAHPTEDDIVVTQESIHHGRILVTAFAAYTSRHAVFAHSPAWGTLPLPSLRPADLDRPDRVATAYRRAAAGHRRRPAAVFGDSAAQIQRAYAALHDHDVMGYFPVAISRLQSEVRQAGGKSAKTATDWLVFDWNDGHYGYFPDLGVVRQPVPADPLTHRPCLCLALGDLVESAIFCAEYPRTHPGETAVLLFRPHSALRAENTGGTAAAAYTRRGALLVHSVILGDLFLSSGGRRFTARDIGDPARLFHAYEACLWRAFTAAYRARHGAPPDPRALAPGGRDIVDALGTVMPQSLIGDTPELQVRRAYQRAQALGLSSEVAAPMTQDLRAAAEPRLVLCWNVSEYVYQPALGAHYAMETDATLLPNRLIDAILFVPTYRRDHPGERAVAIPYREAGSSKWKAVAAYSKDGQVWLHNPETGECLLPGYGPADLENPAEFKYIRMDGNRLLKQEAIRRLQAKAAILNRLPLDRTADAGAVTPAAVFARLRAAGLPSRLSPVARERDPAGDLRSYPAPSLTFEWWGVTYTYGLGHYCTASDGFTPLP